MKLIPLEDRIVVRPDEAKKETEAGIIIPEISQQRPPMGTVVSVGPGKDGDPYLKKILGLLVWFFKAFIRFKYFLEMAKQQHDRFSWPYEVPSEFHPADNKIAAIKEGDRIFYGRMCGTPIEVDGEELLVIRYTDVIAIIE